VSGVTIKHLVFSGGGAKGAMYTGAYEALVESGTLAQVETVAGASAGAIMAALVAAGADAEHLKTTLGNIDFKQLLGKSTGCIPGLKRDGVPLFNFIDGAIRKSIAANLDRIARERELPAAVDLVRRKCEGPGLGDVTFGDLALLRRFDPKTFKDLKVNVCAKRGGQPKTWDAVEKPNLSIARACRASAALPVALKSVLVDGAKYIDGGFYDNVPTGHIPVFDREASLVFAFVEGTGEKSELARARSRKANPYKASRSQRLLRTYAPRLLGGVRSDYNNVERKNEGFKKLAREFSHRTVELCAGVKTTDWKRAMRLREQLHGKGRDATRKFLEGLPRDAEALYRAPPPTPTNASWPPPALPVAGASREAVMCAVV